ncbi:HlyD family secretion protein [Piscinibacter sp.]|uniref:HlyD family secretion protein n=1 Tax=Piscinibacter sp. TaxID=1903157 RepID=UPI0039E724B2
MSSALFREEVIQAHRAQYLGAIRLGRSPSFTLMACIAVMLAGVLVAFAAWGQVTRKTAVPGLLVPTLGALDVNVIAPGVLAELRVREGQRVAAGDVLFVLSTDHATMHGATAALVAATVQQRLAALESERVARDLQARQRRQALTDRIRGSDVERMRAEQEAEITQRRAALAQRSVERLQQLAQEGFVSEAQVNVKQDEWMGLQARAESARRVAAALHRDQQSMRAELADAESQWAAEGAQLERTSVALRQEAIENDSRKSIAVVAPAAGVVTTVHLPLGAAVQAGQTLATLLPSGSVHESTVLEAQLYAPSRTAGFIRPGQEVHLRLAAFPYQKFGMILGIVTRIGQTPINPKDLPTGQAQALLIAAGSQEPMYRIVVKLASQTMDAYGERIAFRPGMTLEGSVISDRRAIWEWVFSPIMSLIEPKRAQ